VVLHLRARVPHAGEVAAGEFGDGAHEVSGSVLR
jgi:hypothetical protein